jgi:hypothetical protein
MESRLNESWGTSEDVRHEQSAQEEASAVVALMEAKGTSGGGGGGGGGAIGVPHESNTSLKKDGAKSAKNDSDDGDDWTFL